MSTLKQWREAKGMSIHDVSKLTGIHPSQLSRYENNKAGVSVETALLFEKISEGAVPVEVWSKAAKAAAAAPPARRRATR